MKALKDHIVENARTARGSHAGRRRTRRPISEYTSAVQVVSSLGLDAATVALPAGISLDERAARMNSFWEKLVDLPYQDVLVVALSSTES